MSLWRFYETSEKIDEQLIDRLHKEITGNIAAYLIQDEGFKLVIQKIYYYFFDIEFRFKCEVLIIFID